MDKFLLKSSKDCSVKSVKNWKTSKLKKKPKISSDYVECLFIVLPGRWFMIWLKIWSGTLQAAYSELRDCFHSLSDDFKVLKEKLERACILLLLDKSWNASETLCQHSNVAFLPLNKTRSPFNVLVSSSALWPIVTQTEPDLWSIWRRTVATLKKLKKNLDPSYRVDVCVYCFRKKRYLDRNLVWKWFNMSTMNRTPAVCFCTEEQPIWTWTLLLFSPQQVTPARRTPPSIRVHKSLKGTLSFVWNGSVLWHSVWQNCNPLQLHEQVELSRISTEVDAERLHCWRE